MIRRLSPRSKGEAPERWRSIRGTRSWRARGAAQEIICETERDNRNRERHVGDQKLRVHGVAILRRAVRRTLRAQIREIVLSAESEISEAAQGCDTDRSERDG